MKKETNKIKTVRQIDRDFISYAVPIIQSGGLRETCAIRQHGSTTRFSHCVSVAYYSLRVATCLKIPFKAKSLVTGGLLHDYYFYDRRSENISQLKNSFIHPKVAAHNAMRDYAVSPEEENIILRHMFPITLIPPEHLEGFIVCVTDKICGLAETFGKNKVPLPDCAELWHGGERSPNVTPRRPL